MYPKPTPEQVQSYQENGFLVVENFLSPEQLANWQATTDEAVAQRLESLKPGAKAAEANATVDEIEANRLKANSGDDYYSQVFTQCIKLADSHAGMRKLIIDPSLGEFVSTLAGVDGMRVWHDQALIKPPFGNPTGWHLDNPYWSFYSKNSISIWVALDDATKDNGCLYYLPGTHKTASYKNAGIGKNQADLFKVYPEWKVLKSVACPAPAGTAVFHNGLTAHGAGANMTNGQRRAMTCAFMPDGETFNGQQNVLPKAYFEGLKEGDVLNDDVINPLVWSRNSA
ncbi:phytanoyl-CoA dioxygenase family protein [bacterium]|nr:MAG: phytanoyl-CoA dioxygenase family protein [bacterium]